MSVRTKILGMVDVIMRVPPLFVIDEILKISMGIPMLPSDTDTKDTTNETLFSTTIDDNLFDESDNSDNVDFHKGLTLTSLKFITCLIGMLQCSIYIGIYAYDDEDR